MAHETLEQLPFRGGQIQRFVAAPADASALVQDKLSQPQLPGVRDFRGETPAQGPNPGQQLIEGKGFDQVIVGPAVEADHAIFNLYAGGEQQDGDRRTRGFQRPANRGPVASRKHPVDDRHLRHAALGELEADLTVVGEIDVHPLFGEHLLHQTRQTSIVFNHQDPHAASRSIL
jgi:hypothetical protein